jgi:hypothetical protein
MLRLQFSATFAIFGEKMAFFKSITNVMIKFLQKLAEKTPNFSAKIFQKS